MSDKQQQAIPGGYVIEARQELTSPIWTYPPDYFKLWRFIILQAKHTNGRPGGQRLDRGQLLTSYAELADALAYRVGYRLVRPTEKTIGNILRRFRAENMITTTKTTRGLVITIVNYETYQNPANYDYNTPTIRATARVTIKAPKEPDECDVSDAQAGSYESSETDEGTDDYSNDYSTNGVTYVLKNGRRRTKASVPLEKIKVTWNERFKHTNIPCIRSLSKSRRQKLKTRWAEWQEEGDPWEIFNAVCAYMAADAFHTGTNERGWAASLDYLIKNDTVWQGLLERAETKAQRSSSDERFDI